MYLIPLFGHPHGHCGVVIKTSGGWFFQEGDAGAVYNDLASKCLIKWALGPHDPYLRAFMKKHPEAPIANSHMFPEFFEQRPVIV